MWDALVSAFSDTITSRKVFLLQQWMGTKLSACSSMEEYVNRMTTSWACVKAVGFKIDEEVCAPIMLAGLPSEYKPLILGIENSSGKLKIDTIKNLLLQGSLMKKTQQRVHSSRRRISRNNGRKLNASTVEDHISLGNATRRERKIESPIIMFYFLLLRRSKQPIRGS